MNSTALDPESVRLAQDARRERNGKRWGPYLAERQRATVREDYSEDGSSWKDFPYHHSIGRAYRWGEDRMHVICRRQSRLCLSVTLGNGREPEAASLGLLPTFCFRNSWSWGRSGEGYWPRPRIAPDGPDLLAQHATLGNFRIRWASADSSPVRLLFTENQTNAKRLFGGKNEGRGTKDGFNLLLVNGDSTAVNSESAGTKVALYSVVEVPGRVQTIVRLLQSEEVASPAEASGHEL